MIKRMILSDNCCVVRPHVDDMICDAGNECHIEAGDRAIVRLKDYGYVHCGHDSIVIAGSFTEVSIKSGVVYLTGCSSMLRYTSKLLIYNQYDNSGNIIQDLHLGTTIPQGWYIFNNGRFERADKNDAYQFIHKRYDKVIDTLNSLQNDAEIRLSCVIGS